MSCFNEKDLERQDLEDKIKDLEADLYETIPFKRSQAHVHGFKRTNGTDLHQSRCPPFKWFG